MGMNIVRTKTGNWFILTQIKRGMKFILRADVAEEVTKKVSRNGVVFFSHIQRNIGRKKRWLIRRKASIARKFEESWKLHAELEPYVSSVEQIPDIVVTEGERAWCIGLINAVSFLQKRLGTDETSSGEAACLSVDLGGYESQHKLTDTFS